MKQKIKTHCNRFGFALLVFLALSTCLVNVHYVVAQPDETSSKIQEANVEVQQAFNAILDAEKSSANITSLINQLNSADKLLAQAENEYRSGDNASALSDANLVLLITYQVTFGAQDAKEAALASAQNALWFTVVATIGAMILFVLALILVWRWFKRRYSDRLSDANVEVISE